MSRAVTMTVTKDGVPVEVLAGSVRLRMDAQSGATLRLDPSAEAAVPLSGTASYTLSLVQEGPSGVPAPVTVMRDAVGQAASYLRSLTIPGGGSQGEDRRERALSLQDRLWAFKDAAGAELLTVTDTDTRAELNRIASLVGASGARSTTPPVPIARVDYTRDSGYWAPLVPYFEPWEPTVFVDPSSGQIRVYDGTTLHADMPRATRPLTLADYNDLQIPEVSQRRVATQARVTWQDFAGDGPQAVLVSTRRDEDPNTEGQSAWVLTGLVADDPDQPGVVTREVPMGDGLARSFDGEPLEETETRIDYYGDFTRIRKKTTTVKAKVRLPFVGESFRPCEEIVETHFYEPDPAVPGRYLFEEHRTETFSYYVYTDTGNPLVDKKTATPVRAATWSGTVDAGGDTSQAYDYGLCRTLVERRHRTGGGRLVTVTVEETDELRGVSIPHVPRTEIGDNSVTPAGRLRAEYVGTAGKRALQVDATRIGRALGRELAERLLTRSGTEVRTIKLKLSRADYSTYRLGSVVTLASDAPWGLAGPYLITEVDFDLAPPAADRHPVVQTLGLTRTW